MTDQDLLDLHERISHLWTELRQLRQISNERDDMLERIDQRLHTLEQIVLLQHHQQKEAHPPDRPLPFPPKDTTR